MTHSLNDPLTDRGNCQEMHQSFNSGTYHSQNNIIILNPNGHHSMLKIETKKAFITCDMCSYHPCELKSTQLLSVKKNSKYYIVHTYYVRTYTYTTCHLFSTRNWVPKAQVLSKEYKILCFFLKTKIICWYELIDSTDIHLELCLISQLSPDLTSSLHPKRLH